MVTAGRAHPQNIACPLSVWWYLHILNKDWSIFMNKKSVGVFTLVILGMYFIFFHSSPFPFSHDAIGLPPFHTVHTIFGVVLLVGAVFVWKKK